MTTYYVFACYQDGEHAFSAVGRYARNETPLPVDAGLRRRLDRLRDGQKVVTFEFVAGGLSKSEAFAMLAREPQTA